MSKKITFPHVGDYYVAPDYLFRKLGFTTVIPPKTTQKTLNHGVAQSPGEACLPFKCVLGNYLETLKDDDITIVGALGGKRGMCRLRYYGELGRKILKDNNHEVELITIKPNKEFFTSVKRHFPNTRFMDFVKHFYGAVQKLKLVEEARFQSLQLRPFENKLGDSTRLYKKMLPMISDADSIKEIREVKKHIIKSFKNMPRKNRSKVLKIGFVGEFFLMIDQFSTMNIEEYLGNQGVIVYPSMSLSGFMIGSIKQVKFMEKFITTEHKKIEKLAKPYIKNSVGGHGMETVGQVARFAQQGLDGVVHLYPLTCMPEIVATSVMPVVSEDYNIPVLSLCMDEQTGSAGVKTRLEAFVDMIRRKK